ncbi:MAG: hypothetical protein ACKVWV_19920 [Planctomycetota bacterium]
MIRHPHVRALLASMGAASLAHAAFALPGDVLVVSPTGPFTEIQAAIDASADFDTILVKPFATASSSYAAFTIDGRSLSIVGDSTPSLPVRVNGEMRIQNVASNGMVVLGSLRGSATFNDMLALRTQANQGHLRIEACTLIGKYSGTGTTCANVGADFDTQFVGSMLSGANGSAGVHFSAPGQTALYSSSPLLRLYGCTLNGGHSQAAFDDEHHPGASGGHGLMLVAGGALVAGSTLQGGAGSDGGWGLFSGFTGNCSSPGPGGNGGNGIQVGPASPPTATPAAFTLESSMAGGAAGSGGPSECGGHAPHGQAGVPVKVDVGSWTPLSGDARVLSGVPLAREGGNLSLTLHGAPGDRAYVQITKIDASTLSLVAAGPGHDSVTRWDKPRTLYLGVIPPTGTLSVSVPVGTLEPTVESVWWSLRSLFFDTTGALKHGNSFVVAIVDSSF